MRVGVWGPPGRWAVPGSPRVHAVTRRVLGPAEARGPLRALRRGCGCLSAWERPGAGSVWWQEDGGCPGGTRSHHRDWDGAESGQGEGGVWLQYGAPLARRLSSWGEHLVFHPKTSSSRLPWGRQPGLRARWTPSGLLLALSGPRLWHGFVGGSREMMSVCPLGRPPLFPWGRGAVVPVSLRAVPALLQPHGPIFPSVRDGG